jgi:hypothetical protein
VKGTLFAFIKPVIFRIGRRIYQTPREKLVEIPEIQINDWWAFDPTRKFISLSI